jgi:hypothetical protein
MSEENVEIAKALFPGPIDVTAMFGSEEAINAARALYEPLVQPDFVTVNDPQAALLGVGEPAGDGTSIGVEGFIALWRDFLSAWESWVVTPVEFREIDDQRVLVLATTYCRSRTPGVDTTLEGGGNLLTFRDGKVARMELFLTRQAALEAAGL